MAEAEQLQGAVACRAVDNAKVGTRTLSGRVAQVYVSSPVRQPAQHRAARGVAATTCS